MSLTDLDRFKAACIYPGELDEQAVERELTKFLQALGLRRHITRLRRAGHDEDDPSADVWILGEGVPLHRAIEWILREWKERNPGVPRFSAVRALWRTVGAARVVRALFGFEGFAAYGEIAPRAWCAWCLRTPFGFEGFAARLSHRFAARLWARAVLDVRDASAALAAVAALAALDARETALSAEVDAFTRLRPLFEAFVRGCWLLYWADDTLYWVAKPTLHREPGTQRLHHDTHAALESDVVNLYFWHGVMVPPFVILRPDQITIARIDHEINAEVRRAMIERYRHGEEIHGAAAFIRDAGGERLDHDERYGTLWRRLIRGSRSAPPDEPIVMIEVVNRTREPDGRFRHYWLRVPPTMRTAREAVAWTFNVPAERYAPEKET